jgi:hypothetical protein
MHLFRRNLDLSEASPREATERDLTAISRLLRSSTRRFMGFGRDELPALLAGAPTMLLMGGDEIWGAAIGGWRSDAVSWMRGLALANNLPVGGGLDRLLPPFHALLRSHGLHTLFYAGDEAADSWLQPELKTRGYTPHTDVVVYEKRSMTIPSEGNPTVRVRHAQTVDLPTVLAIDQACFEPQWHKDEGVIGPALVGAPYFTLAELGGVPAGYTFATTHFGVRLIHLVMIAVVPA